MQISLQVGRGGATVYWFICCIFSMKAWPSLSSLSDERERHKERKRLFKKST